MHLKTLIYASLRSVPLLAILSYSRKVTGTRLYVYGTKTDPNWKHSFAQAISLCVNPTDMDGNQLVIASSWCHYVLYCTYICLEVFHPSTSKYSNGSRWTIGKLRRNVGRFRVMIFLIYVD